MIFGNSWRADDFFDDDVDCDDNKKCVVPPPEEEACTQLEKQQGVEKCSVIRTFAQSDSDAQVRGLH